MSAQTRVLKRRIRSVQSTKKITRAMELIATSRIAKAQAQVAAARPYTEEITSALSELGAASPRMDSPLLVERPNPRRAAALVITSDRGLCGGYNANVLRAAEELVSLLREQDKEPVLYVIGRKGVNYYRFRQRPIAASWTGFSERPGYADMAPAADELVDAFLAGSDEGGIDELHVVYTEFRSMLTQTPLAKRMAPLEVEYTDDDADEQPAASKVGPSYEFEPDPDALLDVLLPKYVKTRIYAALLESAASESAARRRAMKAATDNANDLITNLTREANQARQAQITQEISEIVGGADALAAAAGSDH